MAEDISTESDASREEAGWKCAWLIAEMLDGQDRRMAHRIIEQQKRVYGVNNHKVEDN